VEDMEDILHSGYTWTSGCSEVEMPEKIEIPADLDSPESILSIHPSVVFVSRCTGLCMRSLRQGCSASNSTYRSVDVVVKYMDGHCVESSVEVREDSDCECECPEFGCPGSTERDETICLCQCIGQKESCGEGKVFNRASCACECIKSETDGACWWRHAWNTVDCTCMLDLSSTEYTYIAVGVVSVMLVFALLRILRDNCRRRALQRIVDENTTYGMSRHLLRAYVKIKPSQKQSSAWDYVNTY